MSEEECVDIVKQQVDIARSHLSNALECVSRPNKEYDKAYCELSKVNSAVTLANYAVLGAVYDNRC